MSRTSAGVDDLGNLCSCRFVIYGLFDPRTQELRYIGKSINGLWRGGRPFKDVESGQIFYTHSEAARFFGVQQSKVWAVLHGVRHSCGGRRFQYVE